MVHGSQGAGDAAASRPEPRVGFDAVHYNSGRCVVPASEQSMVVNIGSDTKLDAHHISCSEAAQSVQAMMDKGVQSTRPAHFTFRTSGFRWSCLRRNVMDKHAGPLFPTT
jgi:hypothetical protein